MTQQTIKDLPFDTPYYIDPDYEEMFDTPTFFVDENGLLGIDQTYSIDIDDKRVSSPIGRIGVMRSFLIDDNQGPHEVYLADLRFTEEHQLQNFGDKIPSIPSQEEYMELLSLSENAIKFDGFIAAEQGAVYNEKQIPHGIFYGNPALYPALGKLRKKGSSALRSYFQKQKALEEKQKAKAQGSKKQKVKKS